MLKNLVKGTHFLSSDEIKNAVKRKLKSFQEEEFPGGGVSRCFRGWQEQMQK